MGKRADLCYCDSLESGKCDFCMGVRVPSLGEYWRAWKAERAQRQSLQRDGNDLLELLDEAAGYRWAHMVFCKYLLDNSKACDCGRDAVIERVKKRLGRYRKKQG